MAAGAVLAVAPPAGARTIITDPPDITIDDSNDSQYVDVNNDGIDDFEFSRNFFATVFIQNNININYNQILKYDTQQGPSFAYRFTCSEIVPDERTNSSTFAELQRWGDYPSGYPTGPFVGESGYIGVYFYIPVGSGDVEAGWHYGWIEFEGDKDGKWGKIKRWAYETDAE
ncbi:MAG: hypothetical protein JRK53_02605, partial [Deltaproteobacteria bacterium]|nr:hypothetical protein [Deltaproteobacteria bacterium]